MRSQAACCIPAAGQSKGTVPTSGRRLHGTGTFPHCGSIWKMTVSRHLSARARKLVDTHHGERGAVSVEYLQLVVLVAIGCALAIAPLGSMLLDFFDVADFVVGLPIP